MKMGMRIRLWARQAPSSHVVATVAAIGLLVTLLVAVAAPDDTDVVASVSEGAEVGDGAASVSDGVASGAGAADAASTREVADSSSNTQSAPGRRDATGKQLPGASGSKTASSPGAATSVVARAASDRGITADTIKIGFVYAKGVAVDAAGFVVDNRKDLDQVVQAYVDSVNKAGGINGRRLIHVTTTSDPTDSSTWRPACIEMTEDEKVFAAMTGSGFFGATNFCFVERQTPVIIGLSTTLTAAQFRAGRGYIVSEGANGSRNLLNWASIMLANGTIGPGKGKLGILTDDCPETRELPDLLIGVAPELGQNPVGVLAQ